MIMTIPKTDWDTADVVTTSDMNAIGNNLATLRQGGGESGIATVTFANLLDIDMIHNVFYLTGTPYNVQEILVDDGTTQRDPGNIITLIFSAAASIQTGYGPTTNYGTITSSGNISVAQWEAVQLVLIGADEWLPIHVA